MMKYPLYSLNKPYSKTDTPENKPTSGFTRITALQISLPNGGGSIRHIDKKFFLNAAHGTAEFRIKFLFSASGSGSIPYGQMCSIDFIGGRKLQVMNACKSTVGEGIFIRYKPQYYVTLKIKKR